MRLFLFLLAIGLDFARGKIFEKCELASDLVTKYNVSSEEVKSLVCIAEFESTFNSAAINHFNWDGSKDFGLFQLNNKYWCGKEEGQNVCKTSCEAFLDDDLTDDLRCVQIIIKDTKRWMKVKNGYVAWVAYVNRCQTRNLDEYMSECARALTTTTMATSEAPVVTTVKQEVPPKTPEPIRTTQQKPDQVRGPQLPIRTSQQKPDQVRGPQIPIYRPIPVRDSQPQTEIQAPLINDIALKPLKAPLMNIEIQKDTTDHLSPQSINPLSVSLVNILLQALTGAMSQFDFKLPNQTPTQTSLTNDVDANLPDVKSHHPELPSQTVPVVGNYLDNATSVLHTQTGPEVIPNLSNLNKFIFGGLTNIDANKPGIKLFPNHPIANHFKGLTRFQTIEPAGIPIMNSYNSFQFPSASGQIRSPQLTLNRNNYYAIPFGNPLINSQGTFPQFFINGYGVYNPYQNFHRNRNVLHI